MQIPGRGRVRLLPTLAESHKNRPRQGCCESREAARYLYTSHRRSMLADSSLTGQFEGLRTY